MMMARRLILMIALMIFHSELNLALASPAHSSIGRHPPQTAGRP
jgi:hypothetical protein